MHIRLCDYDAWFLHTPRAGGEWMIKAFAALGLKTRTYNVPILLSPEYDRDRAFAFVRYPSSWYMSYWRYLAGMNSRTAFKGLLSGLESCMASTPAKFVSLTQRFQPAILTRLYEWLIGPIGCENVRWVGRYETIVRDTYLILKAIGIPLQILSKERLEAIEPVNCSRYKSVSIQERHRKKILAGEFPTVLRWYSTCFNDRDSNEHARRYAEDVGPWVRPLSQIKDGM